MDIVLGIIFIFVLSLASLVSSSTSASRIFGSVALKNMVRKLESTRLEGKGKVRKMLNVVWKRGRKGKVCVGGPFSHEWMMTSTFISGVGKEREES